MDEGAGREPLWEAGATVPAKLVDAVGVVGSVGALLSVSTVLAVVFALGAVSSFSATALVRSRGDGPGVPALAFCSFTLGVAMVSGFLLTVVDLPFDTTGGFELSLLTALTWAGGAPWLLFALRYTGRDGSLTVPWLPVLSIPALVYLFSRPGQSLADLSTALNTVAWFLNAILALILAAMYVIGAWLVVQTSYRQGNVSVGASSAYGVVGVSLAAAPLLGFFAFAHGTQWALLTVGTHVTVAALVLCWLVLRTDSLSSTAVAAGTAARERAFLDLADTAFVLDDRERIAELNDAAVETFDRQRSEVIGRPLGSVVDISLADLRTTTDGGIPGSNAGIGADEAMPASTSNQTVTLDTTTGTKRFDVRVSTLTDRHDRQLGSVVSLRDVTDRELREQRIAIFNRVLRHNLRNKLSVVRSATAMLDDETVDQDRLTTTIESATDELLSVGRQAREIEQLLEGTARHEPIAIGSLLETAVDDARAAYPAATYTASVADGDRDRAVPRVLTYTIDELLENAVKHNDTDEPQVEVAVAVDGNVARISVTDNGPGIPEQEQVAIREEAESPLEHASGLGLWSVRWTVTAIGGEVTVSSADSRGAIVELTVPLRDR